MKKQLSTAMAAAMAFGTVVPAFTSEVNAATADNKVDLSKAYTFLDAAGNAVTATEVATNGAPVLTRAQVYNYNGANADDRAAHTLKPQFADAKILFEKQDAQNAANDLFVMVKVDDDALKSTQAQKKIVDAKVEKSKADENTVETFTAEDFKISHVDTNKDGIADTYQFANSKLNTLATSSDTADVTADGEAVKKGSGQAEKDAKTALAKEFVNNGVNITSAGTVIPVSSQKAKTTTDINKLQTQISTLKNEISDLSTKINKLNTAASLTSAASLNIKVTSVSSSGVKDTSEATATLSNNSIVTDLETLREKIVNTVLDSTNFTFNVTSTNSASTGEFKDVKCYKIESTALDGAKELLIPEAKETVYTSMSTALTSAQSAVASMSTALTKEANSLSTQRTTKQGELESLQNTLNNVSVAEVENQVNVVLNVVNQVINDVLNGVLRTSKDTDITRNGSYEVAKQLKDKILTIEIDTTTKDKDGNTYKYFTTDANGNLVINKDAIIEYNSKIDTAKTSSATVLISNNKLNTTIASELIGTLNNNLEEVSNRNTLFEALVSYDNSLSADNKFYKAGRTVYVEFSSNAFTGETFAYENQYEIPTDNNVESLRNEITKGLSGLGDDTYVVLGAKEITINFNTEKTTAKIDRQVYEATNKVKYALEKLIEEKKVVAVKTETGNSNQNTVVSVYVANTDGTADTTQKVITLTFNNTIEARVNVAGQPSVVTIPAIEKTDFANITWAQNEIVDAMLAGYIDTTTEFRPKDSITRGEFAKIVCTVFGIDTRDDAVKNLVNPFQDVKEGDWYYKYVVALYNQGTKGTIINGFQDGTFKPNGNITRQEAAKMVAAAYDMFVQELNTVGDNAVSADKDGVVEKVVAVNGQTIHVDTVTKFTDDKEIASWADESVTALVKENVIKGYEDGTFKPNEEIKRVDALYMLVKANKQVTADDSDIQ